eukprot:5294469-Amphidinium_carterae.1
MIIVAIVLAATVCMRQHKRVDKTVSGRLSSRSRSDGIDGTLNRIPCPPKTITGHSPVQTYDE